MFQEVTTLASKILVVLCKKTHSHRDLKTVLPGQPLLLAGTLSPGGSARGKQTCPVMHEMSAGGDASPRRELVNTDLVNSICELVN